MSLADLLRQRSPSRGIDLGGGFIVDDPTELETQRLRFERIHGIVRQNFIELPAADLQTRGRRVIYGGQIFDRYEAVVLDGDRIVNREPNAFYRVGRQFHFLVRAGTVRDLEQRKQEREQARVEAERQKRLQFAALPRRPVTAGDIAGKKLPTLREAAQRIEQHGGVVTARDGELIIEIAETGIPDRERIVNACRTLFSAQSLVLDALANNADGLADLLPDEHVRAGGGVG